ncbi:uncharacterized protein LOC114365441 [Ostrinia furnacalis]|uniref:uncharacterized protein LOC114365441 n=1 Tax=Ostrinia furnacalis TaxID=93504 RepID=UPI00103A956B|nr:uncharacterized protein LOC114365441 [Ostrinia furnacalis]
MLAAAQCLWIHFICCMENRICDHFSRHLLVSGVVLSLAMSMERRSYSGPSTPPPVSKRLFATVVLFIGVICVFGGYLLGRMARVEPRHAGAIVSANLSLVADQLYKKAKRIPPKAVHHNDPEKIRIKLHEIFQCNQNDCGSINNYNLSDYLRNSINYQMIKLMKSIHNATTYLDSLR